MQRTCRSQIKERFLVYAENMRNIEVIFENQVRNCLPAVIRGVNLIEKGVYT